MKKLVVVLIMGLCGSAVFAQETKEEVVTLQKEEVKSKRTKHSDRPGATRIVRGQKEISTNKTPKLVQKANLQTVKAVVPEKKAAVTKKSADK